MLSFPHLLNADEEYTASVKGLHPESSRHELFVTLEPVSTCFIKICFIRNMGVPSLWPKGQHIKNFVLVDKQQKNALAIGWWTSAFPGYAHDQKSVYYHRQTDEVQRHFFKFLTSCNLNQKNVCFIKNCTYRIVNIYIIKTFLTSFFICN